MQGCHQRFMLFFDGRNLPCGLQNYGSFQPVNAGYFGVNPTKRIKVIEVLTVNVLVVTSTFRIYIFSVNFQTS